MPPPEAGDAAPAKPRVSRDDVGFLLAKSTQRWNEWLADRFSAAGFEDVSPAYGSVLLPLYEEDGLRMGDLARRAMLSKQTMTEMVRRLERDGLVRRKADPADGRASRIFLTARSRRFEPVAATILADLDQALRRRLGAYRTRELKRALRDLMDMK